MAFKVQNQLLLTITKSKKGKLLVDHITIVAKSPDTKITELEQFKCFNFEIGGTIGNREVENHLKKYLSVFSEADTSQDHIEHFIFFSTLSS